MKYMQYGGFQNHPLMRLTLFFALFFLFGFWVTNFALYFAKMNLNPQSVIDYYLGSEAEFRLPRTYQSMLEVTHAHLPMMAMMILLLTHLFIFSRFQNRTKVGFITAAFLSAFFNEAAGWLVRFIHPQFAWLKVITFVVLQGTLAFLIFALAWLLLQGQRATANSGSRNYSSDFLVERQE
jgi:hypothetical protein